MEHLSFFLVCVKCMCLMVVQASQGKLKCWYWHRPTTTAAWSLTTFWITVTYYVTVIQSSLIMAREQGWAELKRKSGFTCNQNVASFNLLTRFRCRVSRGP